jgi:hypothetical protein
MEIIEAQSIGFDRYPMRAVALTPVSSTWCRGHRQARGPTAASVTDMRHAASVAILYGALGVAVVCVTLAGLRLMVLRRDRRRRAHPA